MLRRFVTACSHEAVVRARRMAPHPHHGHRGHTAYVVGSAPDAMAILSHPKMAGEQLNYTFDHGEGEMNGKYQKKIS